MGRSQIFVLYIILLLPMLCGCGGRQNYRNTMECAEKLMNSHPDSALAILSAIDKKNLNDDKDIARYALLMSMALDKNYIDTTSFEVLQPAIDYYLEQGTADERLRTLYYQGRIFLNRNDYDNAMQSFLRAELIKDNCTDTLTYANMLVAQSILYYFSYQFDDFISNNLRAADLYDRLNNLTYKQSCLIKALDGSICLGHRQLADSLMSAVNLLFASVPESADELQLVRQTYSIRFEPEEVVEALLDSITDYSIMSDEAKLNLALGCIKLKHNAEALELIETIDSTGETAHSYRYLQIKPEVMEANGKYQEALRAYKKYLEGNIEQNSKIYYQKTTVAQERQKLTLDHLRTVQRKSTQIWIGCCILLALIIIIGIIYYQLRIGKVKRQLSEKEKVSLRLENEHLHTANRVLELEKQASKLERDKQCLIVENMSMQISQLEDESIKLKDLLKKAELSKPILDAVQERIGLLNSLFAAHIADNKSYSKSYDKWIENVTEDRDKFINNTRLAFRASHPKFMSYLDYKGLTESEVNYVCLYAIGLRGKEIGEYIQIKRHYHMSSDIRRKLGLKENDTNLSLYIKKLMKDL